MTNEKYDTFINDMKNMYSTSKVNSIKVTYKNLLEYCNINNIELETITKDDIVRFLKDKTSRGYTALQTRISALKDIYTYFTGNDYIALTITDIKEDSLVFSERYFDYLEIEELTNMLVNPQDKAIVLLLFNNVMGKGYEELLNLKVSDIDLENRIIKLSDRDLPMDGLLYDVILDTINTEIYFKYMGDDIVGYTNKSYLLNPNCEYLLKPKMFIKNNNGLNPFKLNGIQRRLGKLSEVTKCKLTGKALVISGVINRLKEDGIKITVASIDKWLKMNNIKLQPYEVYRVYNLKFNGK